MLCSLHYYSYLWFLGSLLTPAEKGSKGERVREREREGGRLKRTCTIALFLSSGHKMNQTTLLPTNERLDLQESGGDSGSHSFPNPYSPLTLPIARLDFNRLGYQG